MAKRILIALSAVVLLLCVAAGVWTLAYPSPADPKNMKYVLWKHGLYRLDKTAILDGLVFDRERNRVIGGRSKEELGEMLGPLVTPAQASPYLSRCISSSNLAREDLLFVGDSSAAILFENGHARDLRIVKGC